MLVWKNFTFEEIPFPSTFQTTSLDVISLEYAVNLLSTEGALAVSDGSLRLFGLGSFIVVSADKQGMTLRTEGLVDVEAVAAVNVRNAALQGDSEHPLEERLAGRLAVVHLVTREEPGKMPDFHASGLELPSKLHDHLLRMDAFDDQSSHFQMTVRLDDRLDVVQNRLESRVADGSVICLVPFHVDVEGVDQRENFRSGGLAETAVGHHDVVTTVLVDQGGDVQHVILPDGRFAVCITYRTGFRPPGDVPYLSGRNGLRLAPVSLLGYLIVLAEFAGIIAPGFRQRKALGTRQKMIQRLLFDGIESDTDEFSVVDGD